MNTAAAPSWIPNLLVPFVTLSYPVDPPSHPDSFHDSSYYGTGYLDLCAIVGFIAAMAVLRDVARLYVLEPYACWKLTHNLKAKRKIKERSRSPAFNGSAAEHSNGHSNGHVLPTEEFQITAREQRQMRRSVLRFAEQGWALIYYTIQFSWGVVSFCLL